MKVVFVICCCTRNWQKLDGLKIHTYYLIDSMGKDPHMT